MKDNTYAPFKILVSAEEISLLHQKISNTRWPDEAGNEQWEQGTALPFLKELAGYWLNEFDWRQQEQTLNSFNQYTTNINDQTIHFLWEKGKGETNTPIVLLHGWPFSFIQMIKIIQPLTTPDAHGHAFDVIVPSLVGFGFSTPVNNKNITLYEMAKLFHRLMVEKLGYDKFMLRGSDLGMGVCNYWAQMHPENVSGLHLSGSNPFIFQLPDDLSEAEKQFIAKANAFVQKEGAYAAVHTTKPQTIAYGLHDSPIGLAAWLTEKFYSWSDSPESAFTKDELLTNICLYWFTQSLHSSIRTYYNAAHFPAPFIAQQVHTPTMFLMLHKDLAIAPREWEARSYTNIIDIVEHNKGGHFAEWEVPDVVAGSIRELHQAVYSPLREDIFCS